MELLKRCVTLISLLLLVPVAYGQEAVIEGTVTSAESGEPLPGVNVVVKGTTVGTATDAQGAYSLSVPSLQDTLVFSFIGYEVREIPIAGRTEVNVALAPAVLRGEEVVVIGYGTTTRADLTGAVASLSGEDLNGGVVTSVDGLISGKIPGVRVVQTSGQPGGGSSISIRGASSISAGTGPLYVIDGVPVSNAPTVAGTGVRYTGDRSPRNPLSTINPSDIESVEVLKGPSATAIYGARGANGVILITTKSGRAGDLRVTYDGYAGIQMPANTLDLLTPQEYKRVLNGIIEDGGGNPELRVQEIQKGGADWQAEVMRDAVVQSHSLSFSGGSDATQYFVSLGGFFQDGVLVSSGFRRYSGRINLNHEISETFNLDVNLSTSYSHDDYAPVGYGSNEFAGALNAAINYDPTLPVKDEKGEYVRSPHITTDHPLALAYGALSTADTYRTFGSAFGEYFVLPSLSAGLRVGFDISDTRRDTYMSRLTDAGAASGGIASILQGQRSNYLIEGTVNYDKTFGVHNVRTLVGVTMQQFVLNRSFSTGRNFPSDGTGTKNLGLADPETVETNSFMASHQLLSFIGRVNYSLMNRYLLTATMRVDGSSRFGENNRLGYFPSVALAWKMDQEDFIADLGFISTLKLRAGWGLTGNQAIGNYASLVTFNPGPQAVWNDELVATIDPARLANPNLQWETTRQLNIGLDFGFFGERLYGTINYWRKDTYDMLLALPVPSSTGFNSRLTNIGSIRNSGLEFNLSSRNLVGDFSWTTDLNLATLSNEVQSLGPISEIITGAAGYTNQISIIRPGLPLNTYYGYEIIGIWQEDDDYSQTTDNVHPGALKYRDVNDDGTITAADRVPLGDAFPDLTWSIGNTFRYKNLSLYIFIQSIQGASMLNANLVETYFPISFRRNKFAEPYLNRWTPENPSTKYPSFVDPLSQGRLRVNSYTVQDASYARLQTVRLSYTVPQVSSLFRSLTIYATGENLFTLTSYDGMDPALNSNGDPNFRIDYNTYPSARTYTLGLRLEL